MNTDSEQPTKKKGGDPSMANQPSTQPWPQFIGNLMINMPEDLREFAVKEVQVDWFTALARAVYDAKINRKQFWEIIKIYKKDCDDFMAMLLGLKNQIDAMDEKDVAFLNGKLLDESTFIYKTATSNITI